MVLPNSVMVTTRDGQRGSADLPTGERGARTLVRLEDGRRLLVPQEMLQVQADGSYFLSLDLSEEETQRWLEAAQGQAEILVIPVAREELQVRKRQESTGGVRVSKQVHAREEQVDAGGYHDEVEVERVTVNRPLDEPLRPYSEGDTLVIPLMEEVLVVEKRLVLREEVRITRRRTPTGGPVTVTLRSEEATIEPIPPGQEGG